MKAANPDEAYRLIAGVLASLTAMAGNTHEHAHLAGRCDELAGKLTSAAARLRRFDKHQKKSGGAGAVYETRK